VVRKFLIIFLSAFLFIPQSAKADVWGGDVMVLIEILGKSVQQLIELKKIFTTGEDTLNLLRDINRGIRDGLNTIHILYPDFKPGVFGDLDKADRVLSEVERLYGKVPNTAEARLQTAHDQSVAESIAMNSNLFRYADDIEKESLKMLEHSKQVSPQGAEKLTAQTLAVLVGVTSQLLKTNSMMLKIMSENLALENRREKLQSSQFKAQYDGLTKAFQDLPKDPTLKPIGR